MLLQPGWRSCTCESLRASMLLSSLGLSGLQGTETSSTSELFISIQRQSKKWGQGCRGAFRKGWNQEPEYSRDPAPRSSSARPQLLSGCPIHSRVSEQTDCPASSIWGAEGGHPQLESFLPPRQRLNAVSIRPCASQERDTLWALQPILRCSQSDLSQCRSDYILPPW